MATGAESLQLFNQLVANANSLFLSDEDFVVINGVTKPTLQKIYADFLASMNTYPSVAEGLTETSGTGTSNRFFTVPGVDGTYEVRYRNDAGVALEVGRVASASTVFDIYDRTLDVERSTDEELPFAVADAGNNSAFSVTKEGQSLAPDLVVTEMSSTESDADDFWDIAFSDSKGNVGIGLDKQGRLWGGGKLVGSESDAAVEEWKTLSIGSDDSIIHIGDSFTEAYYPVKDKSYVSQLSALSPFRHMSFGVSGNDLLDMQYRAVNGTAQTGYSFKVMNPKYAFITSWNNDAPFRSVDLTFYGENLRRMIDTVRAFGSEPVVTSQFHTLSADFAYLARIAEETGCAFIDCSTINREVGNLQMGPFMQGPGTLHPGSRTGGVFWLPMLDFIDRMPVPRQAIKIFRKRAGFVASSAADLLYSNRLDKNAKWKEITVYHKSLSPEAKYDELSQLSYNSETYAGVTQADEYLRLATGLPVAFTDYALLEVTLPGGANSLEAVELTLGVVGTAAVSVRNLLDVPASMPGKNQGSTPTDPTYLSKWNKPRGAWRSLGGYAGKITLLHGELSNSMVGNTLQLLLTGSFSLNDLKVRYKGADNARPLLQRRNPVIVGSNILAQPLCGTAGQQAGWTLTGAPAIVVPIDNYNSPRKPGADTAIDGVTVVSTTATIAQAFALPADEGRPRKYRLIVWARYFPKAFLRPALYPGLDASQIVDRGVNPSSATITPDTVDLRTLKCEMWTGTSYPAAGGAEFHDFAGMQWRPVAFDYEAVPYITGSTINFKLSCTDGEIQVGKVTVQEIQ